MSKAAINTTILEKQVQDVLSNAKNKLKTLNQEIDHLNQENNELTEMIRSAEE